MKKFRRLFAVVLCLTLMFTIFSACGGQKPGTENGTEAAAAQPTQKPEIRTQDERLEAMYGDYGDRTAITLGTYGGSYGLLIDEFNKSQREYAVKVIDYKYDFPNEPDRAIQKLITEILSGEGPDIIDLYRWGVDLKEYARKGVLEDLYPWLDADEELSRDDFIESILSLCEADGGLYAIMSCFTVWTMPCVKSVADEVSGWSLEDFYPYSKLINATYLGFLDDPDVSYDVAENGFQTWDGVNLLRFLCETTLKSFIDYSTGEAKFDSPELIELLECCKDMQEAGRTENPKLEITTVFDFFEAQGLEYVFGEEIEYIGFPGLGENDAGSFLNNPVDFFAMNALSENKEAAWEFMRSVLTEEYQTGMFIGKVAFPTNKAAFNAKLEEAQERLYYTDENGEQQEDTQRGDLPYYDYHPATDEDVEKVLGLIDSVIGMMGSDPTIYDIVMEEAGAYFAGTATAEDTAKMVQSRVTLYLGEQG